MNKLSHRLRDLAEEYKAGLLLVAAILALGLLTGAPSPSKTDLAGAINRVYNMNAQPIACKAVTTPPTR